MSLDLIIIGAGPAGLAPAIAAKRRNLSYALLEKGALVNSLLHYPTEMIFFTTPELLEIGGLPFVSPYEKPTRQEALKYYRRVVDTFKLDVQFEEPVTHVAPCGHEGSVGQGLPLQLGSVLGSHPGWQEPLTHVWPSGPVGHAWLPDVPSAKPRIVGKMSLVCASAGLRWG